jgi:4-amino-4-deoxy-L-arabinose transferase-like glycosyltransferase
MKLSKILLTVILLVGSFIRLYKLDEVPVSMFGDELDVGYHAYSILKTGRDYSGNFMPLHFQSLAEWRTPLYLYSSVPTVALFGISPIGVRLPAAVFGIISILGIYLLTQQFCQFFTLNKKNKNTLLNIYFMFPLFSAFVVAINPWHIQYSRAGFEVTQLLAFLIFGLYFFFVSLHKNGKFLWLSASLLVLTPLIYSTAKFFTPFMLVFLMITWRKSLLVLPRKSLVIATISLVLLGAPTLYSTFYGGGTARFSYVGIFTDPTLEPEVGTNRMLDAFDRDALVDGLRPSIADKAYHNKIVIWVSTVTKHVLESLSTNFLFVYGDPNLRHSVKGMGQFYMIESIAMLIGTIWIFRSRLHWKIKSLIIFWIVMGAIPSALTRDGGNHASRLILILPPLSLLVSFGLYKIVSIDNKWIRVFSGSLYFLALFVSAIYFQHTYFVHNKYDSERWWHFGFKEAVQAIKDHEDNYDKVIISMNGEPAWIFFASLYPFDPIEWQRGYPFDKTTLKEFGEISYIDKYYFGSPQQSGLYDWGKVLPERSIYLASEKEVKVNLILEPERTPGDLILLSAIAYPSGEPAFYLFAKR